MKALNQNEVGKFIKKSLILKLKNDFCGSRFRIFREEDLHTCAYYHLRRFLSTDRNWEILNEPLLRNLKAKGRSAQPDIVLFHKNKPKIIIELKFKKNLVGISKKDKEVLEKSVKDKKWVKKAYIIHMAIKQKQELDQNCVRYRNKFIPIIIEDQNIRKKYLEIYNERRKPQPRK